MLYDMILSNFNLKKNHKFKAVLDAFLFLDAKTILLLLFY